MAASDRGSEAARRMAAALAPQIREAMASYQATQSAAIREVLAKALTPADQRWLNNMQEVIAPALQLDYSALFPNVAAIQAQAAKQVLPALEIIHRTQREQFAQLLATALRAYEASLPPNWPRDGSSIPSNLEALLLDEGLALAWLPPTPIVERLFKPGSAAERRTIIGRRWQTIGKASLSELDEIDDPGLAEYVDFAHEAAGTLLAGSHRASQALSANLLDSILRAAFDETSRIQITSHKTRLSIEDYPLRVAIVLAGVWGSHGQFWPDKGDSIPRKYTRHGSAHGVSRAPVLKGQRRDRPNARRVAPQAPRHRPARLNSQQSSPSVDAQPRDQREVGDIPIAT